jgi:hypothetical protein
MDNFPILKTGAIAQYPLAREIRFLTQGVRFMDNSSQKYRLYGKPLRSWTIKLDLLDEQELAAVIAFVEQQSGQSFTFTDPITGNDVARCRISGQHLDTAMASEMNGQTNLVIEEIP